MDTQKLIELVTTLIEDADSQVLRIGEIHELLRVGHGYDRTIGTLRKHLRHYVRATPESAEFTEEASGYWAHENVDFMAWFSKRGSSRGIPPHIRTKLWAKAAGVCEFEGCDRDLTHDLITSKSANFGQIAHIVAASPDGPRGHKHRSIQLVKDFSNLMLMCYTHHRLIDTNEDDYSESLLREMKQNHEDRTMRVHQLSSADETQVVIVRGVVGTQSTYFEESELAKAVSPRFPRAIPYEIDLTDTLPNEKNETFWSTGREIIKRQIDGLHPRRFPGGLPHLSIFAIAPIPFLILIGRLLVLPSILCDGLTANSKHSI